MQREGAGWESGDPYAVHPGRAGPPLCATVCSSVKWGDERTELAPLCGFWPGEPSPQPRGSLRRRGPGLWGGPRLRLQSPFPILLRTARASAGPVFKGVCKQFSRSQGHGFITPENGSEDIFVHVSE